MEERGWGMWGMTLGWSKPWGNLATALHRADSKVELVFAFVLGMRCWITWGHCTGSSWADYLSWAAIKLEKAGIFTGLAWLGSVSSNSWLGSARKKTRPAQAARLRLAPAPGATATVSPTISSLQHMPTKFSLKTIQTSDVTSFKPFMTPLQQDTLAFQTLGNLYMNNMKAPDLENLWNNMLRVCSGTEMGRLYLVHDLYLGGAR